MERIQTIDSSEGIIQRIFGLVKVQVETAGGTTEAEAIFTAVTKEEAGLLKEELLTKRKTVETMDDTDHLLERNLPFHHQKVLSIKYPLNPYLSWGPLLVE